MLLNKAADRCARRARDSAADVRFGPSEQSLHEYILFFGGLKQRLQPSRKCAEKEVSFCLTLEKYFWITPGRAFFHSILLNGETGIFKSIRQVSPNLRDLIFLIKPNTDINREFTVSPLGTVKSSQGSALQGKGSLCSARGS